MKPLVEALCSEECAGRAPGTPEGRAARRVVQEAWRAAGLDPFEQEVPGCRGANVIARVDGVIDRYVLVGAHFDHLGKQGSRVFWGADDNAAAIAILTEVGKGLARKRQDGRGVILCAFDGEESPYFLTEGMGSQRFARHPAVPLDRIDLMIAMDLVGHALGPEGAPESVRQTLFALGAEKSEGTSELIAGMARSEPGVIVRNADVDIIPPLSDYEPFRQRKVPILFLTSGRSRYYHTPEDTPDRLDYPKMQATARWLERVVRGAASRDAAPVAFQPWNHDDATTLTSIIDLVQPLAEVSSPASVALEMATNLRLECNDKGQLSKARRQEMIGLIQAIESGLA